MQYKSKYYNTKSHGKEFSSEEEFTEFLSIVENLSNFELSLLCSRYGISFRSRGEIPNNIDQETLVSVLVNDTSKEQKEEIINYFHASQIKS